MNHSEHSNEYNTPEVNKTKEDEILEQHLRFPPVPEHITGDSFTSQVAAQRSPIKNLFSCTVCKKSFGKKRELSRHVLVHSGFKPFKCPHCDKRFGRKDKMLRHVQTVHVAVKTDCDSLPSELNEETKQENFNCADTPDV